MRVSTGRLITIEGLDGSGKSTLAAALAELVAARGAPVKLLREPGGEPCAEEIRALLKAARPASVPTARAEALLYAAARAQLTERVLLPAIERGSWVILDRFVDSSLAYQGGGRALGIAAVREINAFATRGLVPDRTLLLELDGASGRARQRARGERPDRLERESDEFFAAVADTYDQLAAAEPERIRRIDASAEPERVLAAALGAISDLLAAL
ncbi:MAG: dTMP kinase [Acidobacteriota bacterium]|nr:dTMP kinase [Acidobacteriota bacterium]